MKKLAITLITIISLCGANISYAADRYVTMLKDADGTTPITQAIAADEVVFLLVSCQGVGPGHGALTVTKGSLTSGNLFGVTEAGSDASFVVPITGPCMVTYTPHVLGTGRAFVTMKISPNPNIMGVKQ